MTIGLLVGVVVTVAATMAYWSRNEEQPRVADASPVDEVVTQQVPPPAAKANRGSSRGSLFSLAGGSLKDIEGAIGPSTKCIKVDGGTSCLWGDSIEVVFTKHGADWFVVRGNFSFGPTLLEEVSIGPASAPTRQSGQRLVWEGLPGLLKVVAEKNGAGRAELVYVFARSLPETN